MPDTIQDMAKRIKKILHPMEMSSTNPNIYRATMLTIKQTTVVMAFVLVLLSMQMSPFFENSGT